MVERDDGLVQTAKFGEDPTTTVLRRRITGCDGKHGIAMRERRVEPPSRGVKIGQAAMNIDVLGIDREGGVIGGQGRLVLPLGLEGVSETNMGAHKTWIDCDRAS